MNSALPSVVLLAAACLSSGCTESTELIVGQLDGPADEASLGPEDLSPFADPTVVVNPHIYVALADGSGIALLGPGDTPTWSPDGSQIAFSSGGGIYTMDEDGSNVVRLTEDGFDTSPAWSPDGQTIAFTSHRAGQVGIYLVRPQSATSPPTIVGFTRGWSGQPAWSADGKMIAFTSDWRAHDFLLDVYVMNTDGSEIKRIVEGPFFASDGLIFHYEPAFSPDGQRIALVVCEQASTPCYPDSSIAVANVDGSDLHLVAQSYGYAKPSWSPDGTRLAFNDIDGIRTVLTSGGGSTLLIPNASAAAWSPDGRKVAFVRGHTE